MNAPSCAPPELERSIEHAGIPAEPKLERARADRLDQHESPGGRSGCLGVASSREARGCSRAGARTVDRVTAVPLAKWTVHGSRSPERWSEVRAPPVRLGRPRSAQPHLPNNFCSTGRNFTESTVGSENYVTENFHDLIKKSTTEMHIAESK